MTDNQLNSTRERMLRWRYITLFSSLLLIVGGFSNLLDHNFKDDSDLFLIIACCAAFFWSLKQIKKIKRELPKENQIQKQVTQGWSYSNILFMLIMALVIVVFLAVIKWAFITLFWS